jgi:hypothetical protein
LRSKEEVLAWEERWSRPAGIAALAAIVFVIASIIVASKVGGGDGDSELLRNVDAHSSSQILSSILQGIGVALLALPLYVLFTAARNRSERVRGQLVGVVIAGPLFLAVAAILIGVTTVDAAGDFVTNVVPELMKEGTALGSEAADEAATDAITGSSLHGLAVGFGIGGQLGFVIGFAYTSMWAMRTGLLTRFWGSLGVALGVVSFLFFQFALLWFVYIGLLFLGWVPGGRPPAWQSGKAEPWPSPGEQAAEKMGVGGDPGMPGREASPSEEASQSDDSRPSEGEAFTGEDMPEGQSGEGNPPKKRKQRG